MLGTAAFAITAVLILVPRGTDLFGIAVMATITATGGGTIRDLILREPVFLALTGMGVSTEGKLFMGWFGPRGLASIVFAVIVVNADVPNNGTIAATVVCTIMLSILAHGITANPWARGFGERYRKPKGVVQPGD